MIKLAKLSNKPERFEVLSINYMAYLLKEQAKSKSDCCTMISFIIINGLIKSKVDQFEIAS